LRAYSASVMARRAARACRVLRPRRA
jgi:hypothetical protein